MENGVNLEGELCEIMQNCFAPKSSNYSEISPNTNKIAKYEMGLWPVGQILGLGCQLTHTGHIPAGPKQHSQIAPSWANWGPTEAQPRPNQGPTRAQLEPI